jgi:hypothetical protein
MQIDWTEVVVVLCFILIVLCVAEGFSWKRRRKKVNPLETEKEKAIRSIIDKVSEWSLFIEREEILNAVCGRVFPLQKRHVQRNPVKNPKSIYKGKVPYGISER